MPKLTLFSLPVPEGTKIESEYGQRKIGKQQFHYGIDFKIASGNEITSVGEGKVIRTIYDHGDFGNVIIVKHAEDQATLYAHLNEIKVALNQEVTDATILGLSGNTGRSTGPHLHFEVIDGSSNIAIIQSTPNPSIGIINKQGRSNPRQFFDHYSDAEFPATVKPGDSSFGITSGDRRDNIIYGNSNQNTLVGLAGFDTYFQSFSGLDEIIDSDNDGKIIILTGSQSVLFSGNALPKTGPLKEIIAGEWTLAGLNLFKVGEDLVVTKPGVKLADFEGITNPKVPTITIKSFPFSNSRGGFGITLGKKADLSLGEDIFSKTLTNSYLPQGAFAVASSDKGLFGPLAMLDSQGSELPVSHGIGVFDSFGNQLAVRDVEGVVKSSADSAMLTPDIGTGIKIGAGYYGNGFVAYPTYESGYLQYELENGASRTDLFSRVGAIITDASGNVLAANVFANTNSRTQEFGATVSGA